MPEMNNNYNFDKGLEELLDFKSDRIQHSENFPSQKDGQDGEIRVGIKYKGKVLMGVKSNNVWHFTPMYTSNNIILQEKNTTKKDSLNLKAKINKKSNILTKIVTGTTHGSTGTWIDSSALTNVTGDNIISMTCAIEVSNVWYDVSNTLTSATDDPSYAQIRFTESTLKFGIQTNDASLQSMPYRAVIFYRNMNFS